MQENLKRNCLLCILWHDTMEKGPSHRNIPQDSGAGPFSRVTIYDPKLDLTGSS